MLRSMNGASVAQALHSLTDYFRAFHDLFAVIFPRKTAILQSPCFWPGKLQACRPRRDDFPTISAKFWPIQA
jgi:hypothetical protein